MPGNILAGGSAYTRHRGQQQQRVGPDNNPGPRTPPGLSFGVNAPYHDGDSNDKCDPHESTTPFLHFGSSMNARHASEFFTPNPVAPLLVWHEQQAQNASISTLLHESNTRQPEIKGRSFPLSRRIFQSAAACFRGSASFLLATPASSGRAGYDDSVYYQDDFNDMAWSCSFGTSDEDGVWLNQKDPAGLMMALLVWFLIGYSVFTVTLLARTGGIPAPFSFFYTFVAAMALAAHAKTSLTDPGAVPASAVPIEEQRQGRDKLSMCSQCQTFKPPHSHHCRICSRCISRMDHHCPWMNNCVGSGNLKHFILFLVYTWSCSIVCLLLLGWNYFFCAAEECTFTVVLIQLARVMTFLSLGAFLFTSSMIMNVCYGLMTGIGTIDRLKKKATSATEDSDEGQIPLKDVFGVGPYYTWMLPTDPTLENYDKVMRYSTPQRLLREQLKCGG